MTNAKVTNLLQMGAPGTVPGDVTGAWVQMPPWRESGRATAVATLDGDATGAATVTIQGSHDGINAVTIGAGVALTDGATNDTKSVAIDYPWPFLRAVVSGFAANATGLRVTVAQ